MSPSRELRRQPPQASADGPRPDDQPAPLEMAELVAHEVNNLLNNILLHVYVLERKVGEAARSEVTQIRQAGAQAGALINRWQQLTARGPVNLQPVDLNRFVREAVASWQAAAPASPSRVALHLEMAPNLPAVLADPTDLPRLVYLLLVNAASACAPGTITLRTAPAAAGSMLRVEDTGPSFDPALLDQLFEPFLVARPSRTAAQEPLADLGLAICNKLARRQQATIQGANRPEGGVRVEVRFRPAPVAGEPPLAAGE